MDLNTIATEMSKSHTRPAFAKKVFKGLLSKISSSNADRYLTCALPIANYAVDYINEPVDELVEDIDIYVTKHISTLDDGSVDIILEDKLSDKYPIDSTNGSKLTVLACEFVANKKQ